MSLTDFWMVCEHLHRQAEAIREPSGGGMRKTATYKRR